MYNASGYSGWQSKSIVKTTELAVICLIVNVDNAKGLSHIRKIFLVCGNLRQSFTLDEILMLAF